MENISGSLSIGPPNVVASAQSGGLDGMLAENNGLGSIGCSWLV